MAQGAAAPTGRSIPAARPALATTARTCRWRVSAVTAPRAASRGKATLPMAETTGMGSNVSETATAYRPRSAGRAVCDRTSWPSWALRVVGARAASWARP
jgi:hypothetical protein